MTAAGDMLARAIRESGLSQHYIARTVGIDASNINKMIAGYQSIPLNVALQLEKVLDFTAEGLLVTQLYDKIRDARADGTEGIQLRKHWSPEDDAFLLANPDMPNAELAHKLGRTPAAVISRKRLLKNGGRRRHE